MKRMGVVAVLWTSRYTNARPLRAEQPALLVNWCELTITHTTTRK